MSRRQIHPDAKIARQVAHLAGLGLTRNQICSVVETGLAQLYEYYSEALEKGSADALVQVTEALHYRAVQLQDLGAIKFYLQCRAGWRDRDAAPSDASRDVDEDSGEVPSACEALDQLEAEWAEENSAGSGHDAGAGEDGSVLADSVPTREAGYRAPVVVLPRARGRSGA